MEQISFCITTFNRVEFTLMSFEKIYNDERISEFVIIDDASDMDKYLQLVAAVAEMDKVRLIRNNVNQGCYLNKYIAISYAENDYCVIADSDNQFDTEYIDAIYRYNWMPTVLFNPDFAKPLFDYQHFGGIVFTKENVSKYAHEKNFDCIINTMNCFVNRDEFVRVFDKETKRFADDSMYINLKWLEAGNKIFVVPFMQYLHTVHAGSHYQQYEVESRGRVNEILNKFKNGL